MEHDAHAVTHARIVYRKSPQPGWYITKTTLSRGEFTDSEDEMVGPFASKNEAQQEAGE
jgi:hypothetical protein